MYYEQKYKPNKDYLTDYSGNIYVGFKRNAQTEHLSDVWDRIDDGDGELSLEEVTAEAKRDVIAAKKSAMDDLTLSAIPVLLAIVGRKYRGAVAVCSLFTIAGCVSAGFKFYDANRLEKDIEKFNNINEDGFTATA